MIKLRTPDNSTVIRRSVCIGFPAGRCPVTLADGFAKPGIFIGSWLKNHLSLNQLKMLQSTPFLLFDGNCAEAMTFYQQCLGGDLTLSKLADTPMKEQFPEEKHNRIINARLKNGAIDISATDWMASPMLEPVQGNTFSIYLTGESLAELRVAFEKLSQGADKEKRTFMELHEMPFGSYGQFTDRFGVAWIFTTPEK